MPPVHSPAADDLALGIAGRAQPFALAGRETLLVGRGNQADIRFPQDTGCSREQLRFVRRSGGWWVEPLSGSIATLVNGRAIGEPVPLSPGDQIAFSTQRLTLVAAGADAAANSCPSWAIRAACACRK